MLTALYSSGGGGFLSPSMPNPAEVDDEHAPADAENSFVETDHYSTDSDPCLEGNLMIRKGRATGHGSFRWKKRYVHLSLVDGGSISVYEETAESIKHQHNQTRLPDPRPEENQGNNLQRSKSLYSKFHRRLSTVLYDPLALEDSSHLLIFIPNHLPWIAKDVDST